MNSLFTQQTEEIPAEETRQASSVFVIDSATNSFGFVIKPQERERMPSNLTQEERTQFLRRGLANWNLNAQAKRIYAAGGRTRDIQDGCKISPDYAKKLHAALSAANGRRKKGAKKCKVQKSK